MVCSDDDDDEEEDEEGEDDDDDDDECNEDEEEVGMSFGDEASYLFLFSRCQHEYVCHCLFALCRVCKNRPSPFRRCCTTQKEHWLGLFCVIISFSLLVDVCFLEGILPHDWQRANISPIYKIRRVPEMKLVITGQSHSRR